MADESYFPETMLETPDRPEEAEPQAPAGISLEQLQEILAADRQKNAELIERIVGPKIGPLQHDVVAPEIAIDLAGLPDPTVDFMAFQREYTKRAGQQVGQAIKQATEQAQQQTARQLADQAVRDQAERLIMEAAPDVPKHLLEYATLQIANTLRGQGQDPMDALRRNTESVCQQIVDFADDFLAGINPGRDSAADHRTAGIGPGRPAQRQQAKKSTRDEPGNMYKELIAEQQKLRIY